MEPQNPPINSSPQVPIDKLVANIVFLASDLSNEQPALSMILVSLNRLAHLQNESADQAAPAIYEEMERIMTQLIGISQRNPQHQSFAIDTLSQLNQLAATNKLWGQGPAAKESRRRMQRRAGWGIRYERRRGRTGEELIERRGDGAKIFTVTQSDYKIAIQAIAETCEQLTPFRTIHQRFLSKDGSPVKSAYPLRVTLRLLRWRQPALVAGSRSGYQLADNMEPHCFIENSETAWEHLPKCTGLT